MKTSTLWSGLFLTEACSHSFAPSGVISSAFTTAKSVAGFEGSFLGQATSPTLRTDAGGIDTVMSANEGALPRSPVYISAGLAERARVVVTSISTSLDDGDVSATGNSTFVG